MFRRPLRQLMSKRGFSNDTCKLDKTESMLKNFFSFVYFQFFGD